MRASSSGAASGTPRNVFMGSGSTRVLPGGGRGGGPGYYRMRGQDVVDRMYRDSQTQGPLGLDRRNQWPLGDVNYQDWVQPEVMNRQPSLISPFGSPSPATQPAIAQTQPAGLDRQFSPDVLAQNYIHGRVRSYMDLGWRYFKDAQADGSNYRQACELFALADAVSLGDPKSPAATNQTRADAKLAMVYAAVASEQYVRGMVSLAWLLGSDPKVNKSGELPDPMFLSRIEDLRGRYALPELYDAQVRALDVMISNSKQGATPELVALRAVVLFADKTNAQTRTNALFYARELNKPEVGRPWSNLYQAMMNATAGGGTDASGKILEPASSQPAFARLPWEPRDEKPPASRP
jgi:hypothetical protein